MFVSSYTFYAFANEDDNYKDSCIAMRANEVIFHASAPVASGEGGKDESG